MFRLSFNQFLLFLSQIVVDHMHMLKVTWSTLSHSLRSDGRDEPAVSLEIWQDQKPVHHCCPTENRSLSASGQLPSPYCTTSLQRAHTAEAMTRRRSIFYFAARHTRRHDHPPTTSTLLTLDVCGPFWSRLGPCHAPPPDREWEREGLYAI